jgi:hypothetical protein
MPRRSDGTRGRVVVAPRRSELCDSRFRAGCRFFLGVGVSGINPKKPKSETPNPSQARGSLLAARASRAARD